MGSNLSEIAAASGKKMQNVNRAGIPVVLNLGSQFTSPRH
jgi:hypothetical protein